MVRPPMIRLPLSAPCRRVARPPARIAAAQARRARGGVDMFDRGSGSRTPRDGGVGRLGTLPENEGTENRTARDRGAAPGHRGGPAAASRVLRELAQAARAAEGR